MTQWSFRSSEERNGVAVRAPKAARIEAYLAWNEALADAVYPKLPSAAPAYMSLDSGQRQAVASQLDFDAAYFDDELASCVRNALNLGASGPAETYQTVNGELARWKRRNKSERGAPPVLPFLALLTVAAERMSAGAGMAENNFYGRALEVLGHPDEKQHFELGYRKYGEGYWSALERWLEDQDGLRGLPTATAVGYRFVGLPISQVLIREADRDRLPNFFVHAGFPPGAVIPAKEIEPAFHRWISGEPCPASPALLHHWSSSSVRPRILESVATALSAWNGHVVHRGDDHTAVQASLALNVGGFPRARVEFSPIAYVSDAEEARDGEVKTVLGWEPVDLLPFAPGIMRIGDQRSFDNASLLEGLLEVKDSKSGRTIERRPRRIMVFRRVDHAGAFLEAEQTLLGEDVMVVVRSEPARLVQKVKEILAACARPGWEAYPSGYGGLPDGWTLFHGVQMFANPGEMVGESLDLRALVPLTNSQLLLAGGLPLPGSVRGKWHRDAMPEVRAVSDDPAGFTVRLIDMEVDEGADDLRVVSQWERRDAGPLVVPLSAEELQEGNYRVELIPASPPQAISAITLRVRSGDQVDTDQLGESEPTDQFLDDPLSVLSASEVAGDRSLFGGVLVNPTSRPSQAGHPPLRSHWRTARSARRKLALSIATVPADSCLYTGAHYTDIETVNLGADGHPLLPYTVGTCRRCGLTRHFPSSHWRAKRRHQRDRARVAPANPRVLEDLRPTVSRGDYPDWDVVLDGLFHCSLGNEGVFARLSSFLEPSTLMVHHLIRTLSSLGYIEPMRDRETFALERWEVSPTTLVPTSRGWFLTGHWPKALIHDQLASSPEVTLSRIRHVEAPTSHYFDSFPSTLVEGAQEGASALELAVQLPVLSEVIAALPRVPAPSRASGLSAFDPATAKWHDVEGLSAVGGYRMRSFETVDFLRSWSDLDLGTMAMSTVHLSKHAAALLWRAKPLVAYDQATKILSVPLGTNLPGLYERAVVLASGLAPVSESGSLHYFDVSMELAGHVTYLLTN